MQVEDIQRIKQLSDITIDDKKAYLTQKIDDAIKELNNKKLDVDSIASENEKKLEHYRIMLSAIEGLLRKS